MVPPPPPMEVVATLYSCCSVSIPPTTIPHRTYKNCLGKLSLYVWNFDAIFDEKVNVRIFGKLREGNEFVPDPLKTSFFFNSANNRVLFATKMYF